MVRAEHGLDGIFWSSAILTHNDILISFIDASFPFPSSLAAGDATTHSNGRPRGRPGFHSCSQASGYPEPQFPHLENGNIEVSLTGLWEGKMS